MTIRLELKDAGKFFGQLRIKEAAKRGLLSAAHRGIQDIVGRITPSRSPQPVDRGLFNAGWRAESTPEGAAISNREPHAAYVELGVPAASVKPGRAMIEALTGWVQRKGLASGADAVGAAFAIAHRLQQTGIFRQGRGMRILEEWRDTMSEKFIKEEVAAEIRKVFRRGY